MDLCECLVEVDVAACEGFFVVFHPRDQLIGLAHWSLLVHLQPINHITNRARHRLFQPFRAGPHKMQFEFFGTILETNLGVNVLFTGLSKAKINKGRKWNQIMGIGLQC